MAEKTMFVLMNTSMAGHNFSLQHGEIVEQDIKVAKTWIKAGIAEEYVGEVADKTLKGTIQSLEAQLATAQEENTSLSEQLAEATETIKSLEAQLATEPKE